MEWGSMEYQDNLARPSSVDRRALVKGAAWAVPVIATVVATPMAAASCAESGTREWARPGTYNITIPACATRLEYLVRGGGGWRSTGESAVSSTGAELTGSYNISALGAFAVQLFVADGGSAALQAGVRGAGGSGFTRGGSSGAPTVSPDAAFSPGGGGGSSALQIAGVTAVIAGGGGGRGVSLWNDGIVTIEMQTSPSSVTGFNYGNSAGGGSSPNGTVGTLSGPNATQIGFSTSPARGADGTTGGGSGGTSQYSYADRWTSISNLAGTAGDGAGTGGNGASPCAATVRSAGGGGGGGGYAGGGGGGLSRALYNGGTEFQISSGGGGAGSSYSAATAGGAVRLSQASKSSGLAGSGTKGHPGYVLLTWS